MKWWRILICGLIFLTGCSVWKWMSGEPVVKIYTEPYKYVVVPPTSELTSYVNDVSKKEEVEKRTMYESII